MRDKKHRDPKDTKFVRINNSIWIEVDSSIPDEIARLQFNQKIQLAGRVPYVIMTRENYPLRKNRSS